MKGTIFENSDIELYLTEEEFTFLGLIKIARVGGKQRVVYESLECRLQNKDGSDFVARVHLQRYAPWEQQDAPCGGIGMEYREGTCFVKMADYVSTLIDGRGSFEARSVAGEKIAIYVSGRMPRTI
jgi:hypothetical protein